MRRLAIALVALVLAFAMVTDAFARAGRGGSFGSRGSRTFDRPIERSVTPPSSQVAPGTQQPMYRPDAVGPRQVAPSAAMGGARPGFFQRNPMMGGLLAGFVGAGLFGMLFNSSAFAGAGEAAPMASFLGMIFQFAVIGGLVWLAMRLFRRRSQPAAASVAGYQRQAYDAAPATGASRVEKQFEATGEDQEAFTAIIVGLQEAWTAGDIGRLRDLATPEVVSWLAEDLSRDASRGMRNVVEDVVLVNGDVTESWRDGDLDFTTAVITFSARDYTIDRDGKVVDGDPDNAVEATEAWTFVRAPGGRWLASAIEQV